MPWNGNEHPGSGSRSVRPRRLSGSGMRNGDVLDLGRHPAWLPPHRRAGSGSSSSKKARSAEISGSLRPFSLTQVSTDYRYPSALSSICLSPSIWNGFVSIGRPR
jgi:hypothetical protein